VEVRLVLQTYSQKNKEKASETLVKATQKAWSSSRATQA